MQYFSIKGAMAEIAGKNGDHKAVGNWLVRVTQAAADLNPTETHRVQCEVDDVASGKYDWRIERASKDLKR